MAIAGIPLDAAVGKSENGQIKLEKWESEKILAHLQGSYADSRKFYEPVRLRWYLTERFLEGFQTTVPSGANSDFAVVDFTRQRTGSNNVDEEDFIDNVLVRAYMMMVMRMTRHNLALDVQPNSLNEADKNACHVGRIALYDLLDRCDEPKLKLKTARNLIVYGKSFLKVTFNPNAGKWRRRPRKKIVGMDAEGNLIEKLEFYDAQEGQVQIDAISPRYLTFPSQALTLSQADWVQESNIRTVDHVYREYGVTVEPEKMMPDQMEFQTPFGLNQMGREFQTENSGQMGNVVLLKERYYRPCPNFSQGAIVTWCGTTILRCSTLLDYYDDIPFFDSDMIFIDGSIWSDTPFYHALPHQEELNRLESDIMRHTKIMCKPKILIKKGTKIGAQDFTDETGEFIEYVGDVKPDYLKPPELPQAVYENMNRVLTRLQEILGVHDMSRPQRSLSGNAIAYFQELDESILAPVIQSVEGMWEKGMSFALKLMADFYDTPRMVRMSGQNRYQIEEEFRGAFLNQNFTARCSLSQGLPSNLLARQQFVFQAVDKKMMTPQVGAEALDIGDAREALREINMEREIVEKCVRKLEHGDLVPARPWDNHPIYIEVMTRHMREKWEDYSENVRNIFLTVLAAHQQAMAAMMSPGNAMAGPLAGMITPSMPPQAMAGGPMPGSISGPGLPRPGGPPSDQQINQSGSRMPVIPPSAGAGGNI